MKLVGLSILLSIALLTSTVYLVMHQSSRGQNLESDVPADLCLSIDAFEGRILKQYYAHNICQNFTKFTIVSYRYEGSAEDVFESRCLQLNQQFVFSAAIIKSITHEDC